MYLRTSQLTGLFLGIFAMASAQSTTGRFLLFRPSAVSASMGGAGVALDVSPFASYFNAAGLAFSPSVSLGGSFVRPLPFFEDVTHSYMTGLARIGDLGTVALSANLYGKGRHLMVGPASFISPSEDLMDWHVKLSYARSLSADAAAGISLGVVGLQLSDFGVATEGDAAKSTSVLFDGGVMLRNQFLSASYIHEATTGENPLSSLADTSCHNGISIGLSLANIGPNVTMARAGRAERLPWMLVIGVAYSPVRTTPLGLMVTADVENQLFEGSLVDHLRWGGELVVYNLLALRAGYVQDTSGPRTSYSTWGAGLRSRFLHLNVARYTRALLPSWHFDGSFSWTFQ